MARSESLKNLIPALVAAQTVMESAHKSTKNEFFKSMYADLSEVWEACRKPLTDNGLCVVQIIEPNPSPNSYESAKEQMAAAAPDIVKNPSMPKEARIRVVSTLFHVSGEFIESCIDMPVMLTRASKEDPRLVHTPQSYGSAITYARRYLLAALVGVSQSDDDGNRASNTQRGRTNANDVGPDAVRKEVCDAIAKMDEFTHIDEPGAYYTEMKEKHIKDNDPLSDAEKRALYAAAAKRTTRIKSEIAAKKAEESMQPENENQTPPIEPEDVPQ